MTASSATLADPVSIAAISAPPSRPADVDLAAMLRIRHFELALLDCFARGVVAGTTHTCLGQEHVPVTMEALLRREDHVFSNHRGHGHYLARFADPEGLLAEITARAGAVCGGYGGSQHIRRDTYMSTGVQGQSVALAAGVALHLSRTAQTSEGAAPTSASALACAYIGDGTWGEGIVYEALNLAALWSLPLLLVVENNGIAQSTPTTAAMAGTIAGRAAAFGIRHHRADGVDLFRLRADLAPVIDGVRSGGGPAVVEFRPPRLGPHSKGDDTRDAGQLAEARRNDWATAYRAADPEHFDRLDAIARAEIDAVVADVLSRPEAEARHG
jgi:pyruvate dehydrogenase E1 component alpha subunit